MTTARLGPASNTVGLTGWGIFGSAALVVLGGLNVINGFTALNHSSYFHSHIVYSNLTFWGWAFLIWGILQVVAGGLVLAHSTTGYYMGVCMAGTAAILWFFMMFAAPPAAIVGVIVSMSVVYALTVGSEGAF